MKNILVVGFGNFGRAIVHVISSSLNLNMYCLVNKYSPNDYEYGYEKVRFVDYHNCINFHYDLVIVCIPTSSIANFFSRIVLGSYSFSTAHFISCSKGFDFETKKLGSELISDFVGIDRVSVISGASFSDELISNLKTVVSLASSELSYANYLSSLLSSNLMLVSPQRDMLVLEFSGAFKNILAIVSGLFAGVKLGSNLQSVLIAHGIFELNRVLRYLTKDDQLLLPVTVVSDIVLTCTSMKSRNFSFGFGLCADLNKTVEGIGVGKSLVAYLMTKGYQSKFIDFMANLVEVPSTIDVADVRLIELINEGS